MNNKKQVQIIILGDGAVGKTAILKQFHEKAFEADHLMTLGLDFVTHKFTASDNEVY